MPSFDRQFESLTGFTPMKWQRRLFSRFVGNDVPEVCDIPTGLGKTSVIVIWLLALARQADGERVFLPRRLVYIVNRRTVVDQATRTVERVRHRLLDPDKPDWQEHSATLKGIASALCRLCASRMGPLGVSTLRGELADNEEWKIDPARPAIVVGTIDMIGSKLLFSGYGDGRYGRTHHAGLIGYDTLIVHDEAHLTPAFSDLLHSVAHEQSREAAGANLPPSVVRPVRVLELSATGRRSERESFALEREDEGDRVVEERVKAQKRLYLSDPVDSVVDEIVKRSRAHDGAPCKVLIYARTPEHAFEISSELAKVLRGNCKDRVALLTGTMRGHERDALVASNPVYRALLDPEILVEESVYLVSTSAGEVGIDLDADHLVCDLTTLDALIQRLGRVNRRGGEKRAARVDVVRSTANEAELKAKPAAFARAVASTRAFVEEWVANSANYYLDVGPQNLRQLLAQASPEAVQAAFSPKAPTPPLTDILLDNWSLTSIDYMPARPDVAPFLHGITFDPPVTYVAWRREISVFRKAAADEASLSNWFRACPIEARERLRDRTDRVTKTLGALFRNLQRKEKEGSFDIPVVLLDERGGALWSRLSDVAGNNANLAYRTVVLPVEAGGLNRDGMLGDNDYASAGLALDVAEYDTTERRRERWFHRISPDGERYERLISGERFDAPPEDLLEKARILLRQPDEEDDDAVTLDLLLLVSPAQSSIARQTLADHKNAIVAHMSQIAQKLDLQGPIRSALIAGARWHDKGKDRDVWQRYARNAGGSELLAKAKNYLHWRALGGYRHEFGSLLDAMGDAELRRLPEHELVLQLIAAHHGWARPHFEPRSFDSSHTTAANNQAISEAVRRFGQLQRSYGRWGLAWLESLVRCADIAASREAVASPQTTVDLPELVPKRAGR